jgi:hypothetical protein
MENKKEILSYWVRHTETKHYFKWNWTMIWILIKYKVLLGMEISFTVTKACDRQEYLVQFFAE